MPSSQNRTLQRAADRGTKSSLIGILVNLGLALTKCIAGLIGHSFALVADGLESAADVISGVVVLFGLKLSVKPPDADHPYGHGKAEPIAAIVVGVSLLGAAGTIIYESLHQIFTTSATETLHTRGPCRCFDHQGTHVQIRWPCGREHREHRSTDRC